MGAFESGATELANAEFLGSGASGSWIPRYTGHLRIWLVEPRGKNVFEPTLATTVRYRVRMLMNLGAGIGMECAIIPQQSPRETCIDAAPDVRPPPFR